LIAGQNFGLPKSWLATETEGISKELLGFASPDFNIIAPFIVFVKGKLALSFWRAGAYNKIKIMQVLQFLL